MRKPRTAAGYDSSYVRHVRDTSLYVASKLGDLTDELVIVGGLVPSLLIDQTRVANKHVGTLDLDIGMEVAILNNHRYEALTERLRSAGFGPDENQDGNPTRQRWKIDGPPKAPLNTSTRALSTASRSRRQGWSTNPEINSALYTRFSPGWRNSAHSKKSRQSSSRARAKE